MSNLTHTQIWVQKYHVQNQRLQVTNVDDFTDIYMTGIKKASWIFARVP